MDSENEHSQNQSQQRGFEMDPLTDKYEKVLNLGHQTRAEVEDLTKKAIKKTLLNGHIDPRNQARSYNLNIMRQNLQFQNFMTKKKNQSKRKQAFQIIRQMLQQRGYNNVSTLSDRQPRSTMVVRFVNKVEQQQNVMQIEDDKSKQRQKIVIKQGIAWVGLICAIQAVYQNQMYRLQRIIDLSQQSLNKSVNIQAGIVNSPLNAYRVLMVKGPFWKNDGKQNIGAQMIVNQVQAFRYKQHTRIDLVVVMGPILSQFNQNVKNFNLQNTFEEQAQQIIETLKNRLQKVVPGIEVLIMPSTDDVTSFYPIPQPSYNFLSKIDVKACSNPCTVRLQAGRPECKINFINYDLITYIDSSKCGRSVKQPLVQNIQTYLKQPFLLSNTLDDSPFDETNFGSLFNRGQFGNIIVMSSQKHPAFAHKIKGQKVFINIGSMGLDYHMEDKHFMTLMSVYQGQGELADRIKVQSITM